MTEHTTAARPPSVDVGALRAYTRAATDGMITLPATQMLALLDRLAAMEAVVRAVPEWQYVGSGIPTVAGWSWCSACVSVRKAAIAALDLVLKEGRDG